MGRGVPLWTSATAIVYLCFHAEIAAAQRRQRPQMRRISVKLAAATANKATEQFVSPIKIVEGLTLGEAGQSFVNHSVVEHFARLQDTDAEEAGTAKSCDKVETGEAPSFMTNKNMGKLIDAAANQPRQLQNDPCGQRKMLVCNNCNMLPKNSPCREFFVKGGVPARYYQCMPAEGKNGKNKGCQNDEKTKCL